MKEQEKGNLKTNVNYILSYRKFIQWFDKVTEHNQQNPDNIIVSLETDKSEQGLVFITQYNIEQYFESEILYTRCASSSVRKKISALNWFLQNIENRTATPIEYSSSIVSTMSQQHVSFLSYSSTANAGTDPHKGLKNVFSEEENVAVCTEIWKTPRSGMYDLIFTYTWGHNASVRGASLRKMLFCDLNISYGFGPELLPPRNRTLLLVLRKGKIHKDRYTTDKQVGCQRHRDYRQCSVFATGVLLVMKLRQLSIQVKFVHSDKKKRANWWDISLNDFETYSSESSAMRQIFTNSGVKSSKLTHHRTQSVQYAGSKGLAPAQVSTLTKHILDKFHSAYAPEVEEETMKVMSGFRKQEPRFVKTEHIIFPGGHSEFLTAGINHLIPDYKRYIQEYTSTVGDKSEAAEKFLFHIIPYLVETVLQCGFYFIAEFKNSTLTALLRVSFFYF
jgi:hypothetical protein